MKNNAERIQELKEVSQAASLAGRHDIVESIYLELEDMGYNSFTDAERGVTIESKVIDLVNSYVENTPQDQILSNQINNLIAYFGRDKTEAMFKIIFPAKKQTLVKRKV